MQPSHFKLYKKSLLIVRLLGTCGILIVLTAYANIFSVFFSLLSTSVFLISDICYLCFLYLIYAAAQIIVTFYHATGPV